MNGAVFFDLYGTLIDIRTDEYDSWVYETLSRYLAYHAVDIAPEEIKRAKESVYIGDNPRKDLPGAKKAGMKFLLFRSECREYEGFRPDGCFFRYPELKDALNGVL